MPGQNKISAIQVLTLAISFVLFFDLSKHDPMFTAVNVFNADPYDAVGSFGIQLGLAGALIALLRSFRPEPPGGGFEDPNLLFRRAQLVAVLSVAVTLAGDLVAMIRFVPGWIASSGGRSLAAWVSAMCLATALVGWRILRALPRRSSPGRRKYPFLICTLSILILAFYPTAWDEGLAGGILTALLGMVILFATVWALATAAFPPADGHYEDLLDDGSAIYQGLKVRFRFAAKFFDVLGWFLGLRGTKAILGPLNPRKYRWNLILLIAFGLGIILAAAQVFGEGASPERGRFILVASVFIGIEAAGVLLGYGLLGKFLGIYRPQRPKSLYN